MIFRESIFLTGFPGFIAGRLVAMLAKPETQFFLLVQPQFVERAMAEIEEIAAATNTPLEAYAIIEGDITEPGLGIADEDLETVIFETTDVFHLAAVYDLAVPRDLAFSVNLEGTKNVNDFVRSLKNLRRYNYISTCYVAGKRPGKILETELEHDAGFRNFYEETKFRLRKCWRRHHLQVSKKLIWHFGRLFYWRYLQECTLPLAVSFPQLWLLVLWISGLMG